jgi:hypothetical protein
MRLEVTLLLCADLLEGRRTTGVEILEKRADILRETCARDFHILAKKNQFKGHHDVLVRFAGRRYELKIVDKISLTVDRSQQMILERGLRICVPWKCASQYVKHIHDVLISQTDDKRRLTGDKAGKEIGKSSTVLIARHPFVRLISSWNDKLLRVNEQSTPMMRIFKMGILNAKLSYRTHQVILRPLCNA